MKTPTMFPITQLISRHGTTIMLAQNPAPDANAPWQPADEIRPAVAIKGLVQQTKPASDRDLPVGSIRAVAILELPKGVDRPRPGDRITALDRHWRIETILPVIRQRGAELIEAIVASAGGET